MKTKGLILKYVFKEHTIYNLVFTALAVYFLLAFGSDSVPYIFWLKVIGTSAVSCAWYFMRKKYLFFFHNLGVSLKSLIVYALVADWGGSLVILITTNLLRN